MTEAAAPGADSGALQEAVRELVAASAGRGLDAVALRVVAGTPPTISGRVLTERQARGVADIARAHGADVDVLVAADPMSGLEEGWSDIAVEVLDLWRTPGRAGEDMGRQTQYLDADGPLRRLGQAGAWVLVQGPDLAIGWAAAADLRDAATPQGRPWADITRAVDGTLVDPALEGATVGLALNRARAALGAPYVWGGTTSAGFDCSGLVQRVLLDGAGVMLPRHTADQRHAGVRVVAGEVAAGDLLFATPRGQKVGHVVLMTSAETVLHACRTEHRVIEESLADNAARYQHQGWRRPVDLRA
ncbi:MAG: C40 family peptidase [Candidatus Dormibacteraeota bacterium]|nr:C40 family peptidase [Candidatus Dormibacteraeota bacterium]